MTGYQGSPSGYLNPVAVDKIQHPEYDAKCAENTAMREVQYLYPVLHNLCQMLEGLCVDNEITVPTDLKDNLDLLKTTFTTQIDWHPRTMMGEEAAEELNARVSLHEEWTQQEGNEHHSIFNWNNPYGQSGQLQQQPQMTGYGQYGQAPMMQQPSAASVYKPWTWFGGQQQQVAAWDMPPPRLDTLRNGEQFYTANGGGPPPLAIQQGSTQIPPSAIGWNMMGQPIDMNGTVVPTTGERLIGAALTKWL